MGHKADSRSSKDGTPQHKMRKIIAIAVLGVVFLACLLACGYFGAKTIHRSHLRREAMAAYEKSDYEKAERLLRAYVQKDHNAEAEFVALANIYHEFGDIGLEAQMWQMASSLNPLKAEYREKMLDSAVRSASYPLLYNVLGRKAKNNENLSDRELYLYVISSYRSGYSKEGDEAYKKAVEADPEVFHKNELGRMAEFLAKYSELSETERSNYLEESRQSKDPVVRFESLYTTVVRVVQSKSEYDRSAEVEQLLKELVETNYYAGTPFLVDFLFAQNRFTDVISVSKPYLKTIDNVDLALLYAESCTFADELEKLVMLEKDLRGKTGVQPLMADYCCILIEYLRNNEEKLAANVRKSGKLVSSPLSRFIRLRVALEQDVFSEILVVAREIFSHEPFCDLQSRALVLCMEYLTKQMRKSENRDDPSRMADLAKVLAGYLPDNWILTEIILFDQYKKGLAKESDLLDALEKFPEERLFLQMATEFLVYDGKAPQALALIEQARSDDDMDDPKMDFIYMLALDQVERYDEASVIFQKLVERSGFDLNHLADYFNFCWKHERSTDLSAMADRLGNADSGNLKSCADFFRAAVLLLDDDEAKKQEALRLLAATPNDNPEFTFYAANRLCEEDMLDEAEKKYKAIMNSFSIPSLIYVNLSELYDSKGETKKALEAAKEAFEMEKTSMLPAFIYAQRLSEMGRYEEAVKVLNFPRHTVTYRKDIVELWTDCMKKVIEKSIADQRYLQAEEQCKHLLVIVPDDEFGKEKLEKVRENLLRKKGNGGEAEGSADIPAA